MEVYHPNLLPEELIRIANYYAGQTRRPMALRAFAADPFGSYHNGEKRTGRMGEYFNDGGINIYLERVFKRDRYMKNLPAPMAFWIAMLHTTLHEVGHHLQLDDPTYRCDYNEMGYWDAWPEQDARAFAYREIKRLADLDPDLFMPWHNRDMGYAGIKISRLLAEWSKEVRCNPGAWTITSRLREARLRGIHIPKQIATGSDYVEVCLDAPVDYGEGLEYTTFEWRVHRKANPLARIAEQIGLTWQDKRGRTWRYLRLGQAVRLGVVNIESVP